MRSQSKLIWRSFQIARGDASTCDGRFMWSQGWPALDVHFAYRSFSKDSREPYYSFASSAICEGGQPVPAPQMPQQPRQYHRYLNQCRQTRTSRSSDTGALGLHRPPRSLTHIHHGLSRRGPPGATGLLCGTPSKPPTEVPGAARSSPRLAAAGITSSSITSSSNHSDSETRDASGACANTAGARRADAPPAGHDASDNGGDSSSSSSSSSSSGANAVGKIQPRLMMSFTCTKCDTRSSKSFSKQSYTQGVVLIRCPGCQKLHLIADHLGWFGEEPFMVHQFLASQGKNVVHVTVTESPAATPAGSEAGPGPGAEAAAGGPAMPGRAARAAAAAAAVRAVKGGVFELASELQVRTALQAARELQDSEQQRWSSGGQQQQQHQPATRDAEPPV